MSGLFANFKHSLPVLFILFSSCGLWAQEGPLQPADLWSLTSLSSPCLSPSGYWGAVLVSRPDPEANRSAQEIYILDVANRRLRPVPGGFNGIGALQWSPGGDQLSFLASTADGRQILSVSPLGGDVRILSRAPGGVRAFAWSPDGRQIAYIAPREPAPPVAGPQRHNNSFLVGSNDYLMDEAPVQYALWLLDPATGGNRRLSGDDWFLGNDLSTSSLSWSPDGRQIAFIGFPTPYSGDSDQGRVMVLDLASGRSQPLSPHSRLESMARFSPDGRRVAFLYPRDGVPANLDELYLSELNSRVARSLTRTLDRHLLRWQWLGDGRLLAGGADELRHSLWRISTNGEFQALDLGEVVSVDDWQADLQGAVLLVGSENKRPQELYFKTIAEARPVRISDFNGALARRVQGSREGFNWTCEDGLIADGVLTFPPDFDRKKKYPLVLHIHGGPTSSTDLGFFLPAQAMAGRGWIVFQPNYRGSDNRGNAFQRAIVYGAAEGPGRDIMAGMSALVARGYIDTTRIAVSGWSYGGFLTAWLIGRYPGRWKAAVAGAAPVDLTDMYALSDLNRMRRHGISDSPFRDNRLQDYLAQSPLVHLPRITTPTLIMSKTADSRVSITGSYKLFHALRDNGVPVEFYAYPGEGHVPTDPVRSRDVQERWLGWLERYLGRAALKP